MFEIAHLTFFKSLSYQLNLWLHFTQIKQFINQNVFCKKPHFLYNHPKP